MQTNTQFLAACVSRMAVNILPSSIIQPLQIRLRHMYYAYAETRLILGLDVSIAQRSIRWRSRVCRKRQKEHERLTG
jgi:hypothetical protein